ncbi:hypothetical protein BCR37DRAFT_394174 [Protomyces lactucae-debilis]|uniref:5-formyltetrahydrofolate cyclo-ligase n=1 Tax=Protomyces lactucae-debilis TaxID=2754530 RepID=A0A1Y2F6E4_PROLT|nr:uncharacterized protein BCR37DRAFT_394174 [Protomyces lactucae-debilis]ORY79451.1 hypothetical protein BCR37DRAFT_394174 [Protomyces lactucae-debilis]
MGKQTTKQLKALLRKESLARMDALPPQKKLAAPAAILARLRQLAAHNGGPSIWKEAQRVSCFISMDHELDTKPILQALLSDGKDVFVPRIIDNPAFKLGGLDETGRSRRKQVMQMLRLLSVEEIGAFERSNYGIPEPPLDREEIFEHASADLIICPGVVFSKDGRRVGYGGGFFDMYIRRVRALNPRVTVVGVGHECQLLQSDTEGQQIPVEETDQMLDSVLAA